MLPCPCALGARVLGSTSPNSRTARAVHARPHIRSMYCVTVHAAFVPCRAPPCFVFVDSRFHKTTDGAEMPQSGASHQSERAVDSTVDIVYSGWNIEPTSDQVL